MSQSQEKMPTVKQVADRMSVDERTARGLDSERRAKSSKHRWPPFC
jgi:hypothetical protein